MVELKKSGKERNSVQCLVLPTAESERSGPMLMDFCRCNFVWFPWEFGEHREIEGVRKFPKRFLIGVAMRKTPHQKQ